MALAPTNLAQDQIRNMLTYNDQLDPGSALEVTGGTNEDNWHAVISQINRIINSTKTGNNWYAGLVTPSALDTGTVRGVNDLNTDLHAIERKRILKRVSMVGVDITIASAGDQYVILAAAEIPSTTTAAVGAVTTAGTVVADASGSFGTAQLTEVTGANALQPKNLQILTDNSTGDVVTRSSDGRQIYGLLQSENATDGFTITGTTPNRVQISFVVHNSTNDDLELIASGDMDGITFDYAYVRRDAFEDCPEEAWLGDGFADTGVAATTRQAVYDNQGAAVVTTTSNATLDVGTGFTWEIGDAASAPLFTVTEASGTSATDITVGSDVDTYMNNAITPTFDNGVTVDNGSNAINLGVTADQIDFTANGTVTANSGSTMLFTADSANATLSTTTSGNVVVSSAGTIDADGTSVTVDASTGGISLDGVTASNFTVTSATGEALTLSTVTSGDVNVTAAGNADIDGTNVLVDATSAISLDAAAASNFTVAGADLTLSTTTSGNMVATVADGLFMSSDFANYDVNNQSTGHWIDRADFHYYGDTNRGSNYLTVNAQYTTSSSTDGGVVKVTSGATVTNGTITASTAAVVSTTDASFTTSGITGLSAGTFIMVEGASPATLNGLYEVQDGSTTTLTLRGVGANALGTGNTFTKQDVDTNGTASGTIYTVTLSVLQSDTAGSWGSATGSATPLTFTSFGSAGGNTLQQAYVQGNSISVTSAEGIVTMSNSTDTTDVLAVSRTFAGAGTGIDLTMGGSTTGVGFNVNTQAGATGNAINVVNAGDGDGLFLNNTGAGAAMTVQDGGTDVFDISAGGAVTITPTSGTNATITTAGAGGVVDINAGVGGVDVDATGSGVSIDGETASNFTVTSATGEALTLSTVTSGDVNVTAAGNADIDGTNVFVDASSAFSVDGAAASNVTVTGGALTLSTVTSGDVTVTGADDITLTADDVVADVTVYDRNGATVPGRIRLASTFTSVENANEGNVAFNMNTGYTSSVATNNYIVTVVVGSSGVTDTVTAFTNNGAATNPTATTSGSATFSAGDIISITSGTEEENLGLYEVVSHVGNTLTLAATATAGAEFVNNQVATTTGDSAAATLTTVSVMRTNTTGDWQISENFSNVSGISYQDIGSAAGTLSGVVANTGATSATMDDDFTWTLDGTASTFLDFALTPSAGGTNFTITDGTNDLFEVTGATGGDTVAITSNVDSFTSDATAFSLDATLASNITVTSGTSENLTLSTATSGDVVVSSAAAVDVDGTSVTIDSTGAISLDAAANSNVTVASANLTLNTTTSGDVSISAADAASLAGAASLDLSSSGGCITMDSPTSSTGTISMGADAIQFHDAGGGDMHLKVQTEYTATTATTWGISGVYRGSGDASTTVAAGGFTAAVASTSDATIAVADETDFAANMIVLVTGAADACNNGLYEVHSTSAGLLTLKSLGLNAPVTDFVKDQVVSDTTVQGSVDQVSVSSFRSGTDGAFEVATFAGDNTATYSDLVTASTTVTRQHYQTTMAATVTGGGTITDSDVTGTLPSKPAANFTFDTDAEIFLNGIILFNGSGNEVTSGTGNDINVETGGPTFRTGDVITIIYYTNSTAG